MLIPTSPEFVTLCRSQVALLVEGFGASVSVVYLTENLTEDAETDLIPVVAYPEEAAQWPQPSPLRLPAQDMQSPLLVNEQSVAELTSGALVPMDDQYRPATPDQAVAPLATSIALHQPQQLVLPLIHEDRVLGLLVVTREKKRWSSSEQEQLEDIANTLAIARVLDQRSQWLMNVNYHQRTLQGQQYQTLSNLLHQFRNPLTTMRTLGKLLLKRFQPQDANRSLAESIVQQSDRLEEMLHEFDGAIDLGEAALESGTSVAGESEYQASPPALLPAAGDLITGANLQLQPCWLADILDPLLSATIGRVDENQLHLEAKILPELPPVKADAGALREVLSNLLDNALKYTPTGGEIQVEVRRQATADPNRREQLILISDSGPGIPTSDLDHIFERHYRGIQANSDIPGTGLGLAIAHTLIEQMQGQIQAFSPAVDRPHSPADEAISPGSTFIVSLPEC